MVFALAGDSTMTSDAPEPMTAGVSSATGGAAFATAGFFRAGRRDTTFAGAGAGTISAALFRVVFAPFDPLDLFDPFDPFAFISAPDRRRGRRYRRSLPHPRGADGDRRALFDRRCA